MNAPCLKEMPALEAAWKTLQKEDVLLVEVNLGDTPQKIEQFLSTDRLAFPSLWILIRIPSNSGRFNACQRPILLGRMGEFIWVP